MNLQVYNKTCNEHIHDKYITEIFKLEGMDVLIMMM